MQHGKSKKPVKPVQKPYLTGAPYDSNVPKSALGVFFGILIMAVAHLFLGALMLVDLQVLKVTANVLVFVFAMLLFYYAGTSNGTIAVNQGEIMYRRKETDREVSADDLSRCYHPLKGFVIGLIGCSLAFLMAAFLALTTRRLMTTPGVLPSWVTSVGRAEVSEPLAFYTAVEPMTATGFVRVLVRMILMPFVNLIGAENSDSLLILERLSPLLVLLPGVAYGLGYQRGTVVRTRVHTDIAEGRRKAAKKAKRQKKARQRQAAGPQQLN